MAQIGTVVLTLAASVLLASCAVDYDSVADENVNAARMAIDQQLRVWEIQISDAVPGRPAANPVLYDKSAQAAYASLESSVSAIQGRMASASDAPTQSEARIPASIIDQLEKLRALHAAERSFSTAEDVTILHVARENFDNQVDALATFELAVKNGASTANAASTSSKAAAAPRK